MTTAALEYLKFKETERSNLERERQNRASHEEVVLHNRNTEGLQQKSIDETIRANQARELETNRHNLVTEGISYSNYEETLRHNKVTEENSRYATNLSSMTPSLQKATAAKDAGVKPAVGIATSLGDLAKELFTGVVGKALTSSFAR